MNAVKILWDMTNQFIENPKYVQIDQFQIRKLANQIKNETDFPQTNSLPNEISDEDEISYAIFYHLVANSVNYCYWQGKPQVRINGSNARKMHRLLRDAFVYNMDYYIDNSYHFYVIDHFKMSLINNRFPLTNKRIAHLDELLSVDDINGDLSIINFIKRIKFDIKSQIHSFEYWLSELITCFPGYGEDPFLKRAFLFFMELYRSNYSFSEDLHLIPCPIDYHIPNVLRKYGCLQYNNQLSDKIKQNQIIPAGSLEECEIRASSLKACQLLSELTNKSSVIIDDYLFSKKHECDTDFHLTITTNY